MIKAYEEALEAIKDEFFSSQEEEESYIKRFGELEN